MSSRGVRFRGPALSALLAALALVPRAVPAYGAACDTTKTVKRAGGGDYAGIQAAVNAIPATLTGNYCIVIDSSTYSETVTIQGKDTASLYRIKIFSDPSMISTATRVNAPVNSTAAFVVLNDSVTITGIDVVSTNTMHYGIYISSSYVQVSSVNIDSGGKIATAGILLSDWSVVSFASVTVQSAHGLYSSDNNATITRSTAINNSGSFNAMSFYGADSNTVTGCFFFNSGGDGMVVNSGSDRNVVTGTTVTTTAGSYLGLSVDASDFNTFTGLVVSNSGGDAMRLIGGADDNTVAGSSFTASGSGKAAFALSSAKRNVITDSYMANPTGRALRLTSTSINNVISGSTMASNASGTNYALSFDASSTNTVTDCFVSNPGGYGAFFNASANLNVISLSTIVSAGADPALYFSASSSNTILNSYVQGSSAAVIAGSTGTVFGGTVLVATNTTGSALVLSTGSVYLTATTSTFRGGPSGAGIFLDQGNSGLITLTSNTISGGRWGVSIATMNCGGTCGGNLSISSMIVTGSLTAGATAIQFEGGAFVSTFSYVNFGAANIAVNVDGRPLATASRITMRTDTGAKTGSARENDQNALVDWPSEGSIDGCATTRNVGSGRTLTTITAGVAALPSSLTGHSCVVIRDGATYAEQVTVRNFTNGGSSITIMADPASGLRPVVSPPALSTAAFLIANASVNVQGLDIVASQNVPFGVSASSGYVTISSVSVSTSGGTGFYTAGVRISSWSSVSYSNISAGSAYGLWLFSPTGGGAISYTDVTVRSNPFAALNLQSATNTITGSSFSNQLGNGALFQAGANYNVVRQSTMTSGLANNYGLFLSANFNALIDSFFSNPAGYGLYLSGAVGNTISRSTITSDGFPGLYVAASSSNSILDSYIQGSTAAVVSGSTGTLIGGTVFVATNTTGSALVLSTGSVNLTVTTSTFRGGPSGAGIFMDPGNSGLVALTSNTIVGGRWGVSIATMSCGGTCNGNLSISSMIVSGPLTAGATAIQFEGGAFVSTFAYVNFGAAGIAVNVDGRPLSAVSRITMSTDTGARTGSSLENDPNGLVDWPSGTPFAGCAATRNVNQLNGPYTTISEGVSALPASLAGHSCVVIRDGATYVEQVTVRGFVNNASSITIMADPASGLRPVVSPPAASTAAFLIANASVNVLGLDVAPGSVVNYGVFVSSPYVQLSSVNVKDASGQIAIAGMSLASWDGVSYSSVTVRNAYGISLIGSSMTVVSFSSAQANDAAGYAISLIGASSNTMRSVYASNPLGYAAHLNGGSNYNTLTQSTFSSSASGYGALNVWNSLYNTVSGVFASNLAIGGRSLYLSAANFSAVSQSTFNCQSGQFAVFLNQTSSAAISRVYASNPGGISAYFDPTSDYNAVSQSTFTSGGVAGPYALQLDRASYNSVTGSYFQASTAVYVTGSTGTVIAGSVLISTASGGSALVLASGSVGLSLATSSLQGGAQGAGLKLEAGGGGLVSIGSVAVSASRYGLALSAMAGGSVAIDSVTFRGLASGATAIEFLGGTFVATITLANFEDATTVVNVDASALNAASRVTMASSRGVRRGPPWENDPVSLVDWGNVLPANCVSGIGVKQNGTADFTTIQAAVAALPSTLTGHTCVVIYDGATYAEQVTVRNFVNNGSSITIMADPQSGLRPVVSPPASSEAAFLIANASVNVQGLDVVPTNAMNYGISAASANVTIASVNVLDAAGLITGAGMSLASWDAVSYSSVTVQNAYGISLVASSMTAVSYSSAQSGGSYALYLNSASSNTFTVFLASSPSNVAAYFVSSQYNDVVASTMIGGGTSFSGLNLAFSDWNALTGSFLRNPTGAALTIGSGSDYNAVSGSTMISAGSGQNALYVSGSASNTISGSYVENALGNAARLDSGANDNVFDASRLVSNSGTWMSLFIVGGKRNSVRGSYLQNNAGTGVYFFTGSDSNVVSGSTIVAGGGSNGAYYVLSSTGNTLTGSLIQASATYGVRIELSKLSSVVNSTVTGGSGPGYPGLTVTQSSVTAVLGCYVQGSTAVWIDRSTATSVGYGSLVSVAPTGAALAMTGGIGLHFSSNTVSGSAQAAAVRLAGADGYLEISTSAFGTGAQYGIYIASTAAGAQVYIASNTILVSTSSSRDTYGVYLGNLASGATVFNNGVFYRAPGSMGSFTTYGAFIASSPGVTMRRNRFDNPGMITGGSLVTIYLAGAQNFDFEFNDVNSTGTGLTGAYHLQLIGSTAAVRNSVFFSSWTATTKADLRLDAASGVDSNYNDWFSSNALAMSWGSQNYASLAAWQAAGKDAGSISAHPQWFDASAGAEDFHPRSTAGRWNGASFVSDTVDSPTLDAGDPSLPLGAEPANSGCIINQGSYGGLAETSRSPSVLSVSLSTSAPSYYDFGSITLGAVPSTVSLNANVIGNAGTVSESFQLSAATISPSGLYMALGAQAGVDTLRLQGLFHSAAPSPALFDVNASTITGVMQKADTTRYAGDQTGYQVAPSAGQCAGSARSLWFKITPPTTSIYGAPGSQQQQKIRVTVTGILDP